MTSDSGPAAPRPRSQIRDALDAAWGIWPDVDEPSATLTVPRRPWWRELAARAKPASRRVAVWAWGLVTLTLAGVLSLVIYAAVSRH